MAEPKKPAAKTATISFTKVTPKKHSVRFDTGTDVKDPLINSIYVDRLAAVKALGIEDLDKVKEVKLTVEVVAA